MSFFTVKRNEDLEKISIPYMGSKAGIAKELINEMLKYKPRAKYFIDLFGGGGALSFTALQLGLQVRYNDFNEKIYNLIKLCVDNIQKDNLSKYGILPEEFYQFIDRKTFNEIKDNKTNLGNFAKYIYSFGNNGRSYFCNPNLENYKKNIHNFIINKDKDAQLYLEEYYKNSCNQFIQYIMKKDTWLERLEEFTNIITKISIINQYNLKNKYNNIDYQTFKLLSTKQFYKQAQISTETYIPNTMGETLLRIKRMEKLLLLSKLFKIPHKFEMTNLSYEEVNLDNYNDNETIFYLDSPYRNTEIYDKQEFDFDKYDEWLKNNNKTLFMSEYNMPFKEIYKINKNVLLNDSSNGKIVEEKLYVNK